MITSFGTDNCVRLTGLSTDTKPTNFANGSVFIEIDTDKIFLFDEANSTWYEWTGPRFIVM